MAGRAPPPPPPHGDKPKSSNLPPGNYDIFVIPPHSSGSGFLYLPSLQPHRNSFLAGVFCTLVAVGIWIAVVPVLQHWAHTVAASGGISMLLIIIGVGVVGWAYGKTQVEGFNTGPSASNPEPGASSQNNQNNQNTQNSRNNQHTAGASNGTAGGGIPHPGPSPFTSSTPNNQSKPGWQGTHPSPGASGWDKAREEVRKKEEERRKKEEVEKKARERAEKEKQEKAKAREKEAKERVEREKLAREKEKREARDREAKASPPKNYQKPSAQSTYTGDEHSFRPYDKPKQPGKADSQSSFFSESSYAPTQSTARTTPPPSHRGPYKSTDPDKVRVNGVYKFSDLFPRPQAQLLSGQGSVTDGLVLRMTTEGLFIDDDVRGVPQREWDVKAWTLKLVENGEFRGKHVLRASIRDAENRKYIFVIDESEAWKVAVGLQRLRRGSQVRSLGVSGLSANEVKAILGNLGY
ncbi:MAG: hypothetical protein M1831_000101 [Alyxoria varia]|nr:MAG: hypothetical protein M1831_000101 [Alyxoria varia]